MRCEGPVMKNGKEMIIELKKIEYFYLRQNAFFLPKNHALPNPAKDKEGNFILEISEELADAIRDHCGERLQIVGFDNKYSLIQEGKMLETLIDIFFIG